MSLSRRDFLAGAAVGAVLPSLNGCAGRATPGSGGAGAAASSAGKLDHTTPWNEIRDLFSLDPGLIHLSAMLLAAHPRPVRAAIDAHRDALDSNPAHYLLSPGLDVREHAVRVRGAAFLQSDAEEIALTESTTVGLGLVYTGLHLTPGDEIVTTTHDHYSSTEAIRLASLRTGAVVRRISLYEESTSASESEMVDALRAALSPRTRVVAVTWVHSSTGVKLPLAEMGRVIETANDGRLPGERILFCVDGVHGLGVEDDAVPDLACDFLVAGCHKWIYGPRGTAIIWGSKLGWARMSPVVPPFSPAAFTRWMTGRPGGGPPGPEMSPGGSRAFEHTWALAEAFDFHIQIGKRRIRDRIVELASLCKEELRRNARIRLHTPVSPGVSAGIVSFDVIGLEAEEAVEALLAKGVVATASPYPRSCVRFSPCIYNTVEDCEAAIAALRSLR